MTVKVASSCIVENASHLVFDSIRYVHQALEVQVTYRDNLVFKICVAGLKAMELLKLLQFYGYCTVHVNQKNC